MKLRATSYTFDASAKTIDCALFTSLEAVQLIVNVTDNLIIYNFADTSKGGTLASTTLTLEYDTTSMSDTDDLMILVEDGTTSIAINDGGNTITVDGTVTANLSATDNAVLDNIDADLTTIIGHVDGIETLLTTIDADTSNISTKIDTIAGDTTSIQTAVELIDDAVYTDGAGTVTKGIAILGQDGTNPQAIKTDASGELQVDVLTMPTVAVTNAGITTIAGAVSGTEMQVDVITMPTTTVTATNLDIRDLTAASDSVTVHGDVGAIDQLDLTNSNPAAVAIVDGNGDQITSFGGGTQYTEGDTDTTITGTALMFESNTGTSAVSVVSNSNPLPISDAGGAITVDGTVAVTNSDITSVKTATELLDDTVFVDDADWTADTSKHLLVGGVTQVATTANTDGDVTPLTTNAFRELRTAIPESDLATAGTSHVKKYYTNAGAVTDGIIWSPAAGKRWYVTDLIINVSAACTVTLEDDKAGGDEAVMKFELAANSGVSHNFTTPWYSGEDAADLIITTTAGNVYVTVCGYEL